MGRTRRSEVLQGKAKKCVKDLIFSEILLGSLISEPFKKESFLLKNLNIRRSSDQLTFHIHKVEPRVLEIHPPFSYLPLISMAVGGRGVATTPALVPPLIPVAVEMMVVDVAAVLMLLLLCGIAAAVCGFA